MDFISVSLQKRDSQTMHAPQHMYKHKQTTEMKNNSSNNNNNNNDNSNNDNNK